MGQKVVEMETKIAAMIADVEAGHQTVTGVCQRLGISRQTYYKYRRRFTAEGPAGLVPRSRRPGVSPTRTPAAVVELILSTRVRLEKEGWDNGALSIWYDLLDKGHQPPSARTVHRVLVRQGMVTPQPQKRRRSSYRRFQFPATDDCWQIDAYEYTLGNGAVVVVFEIKDDRTRYLVDVRAWPQEDTLGAWTSLSQAISRYGKPRMVLSDNSLAFTGRRVNRVVLVEKNLIALGIKPIYSSANHPQTCGKNERGHQTAHKWNGQHPRPDTLEELQTQLDQYRTLFNQRPHQALGGSTPLLQRTASRRTSPSDALPVEQPTTVTTCTANRDGAIKVSRATVGLGVEYAHQELTVFNTDGHLLVFYRHHLVRELTIDRSRTYQAPQRPRGNTRQPRRPLPTDPGSLPPPTRRREAAVKVQPPTGGTTLTAASTGAQ
jgi:transposase-like protein